jgi:hypothetical protein
VSKSKGKLEKVQEWFEKKAKECKLYFKKERYKYWMLVLSLFVIYFAIQLTFVDESDRISDDICKISASFCLIFILIAFFQ